MAQGSFPQVVTSDETVSIQAYQATGGDVSARLEYFAGHLVNGRSG